MMCDRGEGLWCWISAGVIGAMVGASLMLFSISQRDGRGLYIPCDIAEISPDIPVAAKEQCRRMKGRQ